METREIFEELCKKTKGEIQHTLMMLMYFDKINYQDFNQAYIQMMRNIVDDCKERVYEANSCVCESFIYKKTGDEKKKGDYKHTQRCLYLLDESQQFNDHDFKEKYNYNQEFAKTMSIYERHKEEKRKRGIF